MRSQLNAVPVMYEPVFGVQVKVNENKASEALHVAINSLTTSHISSLVSTQMVNFYAHPPETTLGNNKETG